MISIARTTLTIAPVLAAFLAVGCTSQGGPTSAGPGSSPSATSATPVGPNSSRATAPPSAVRSGGTLPVPKNLVTSVTAWDKGRGGAALQVVSGQVGAALQATGIGQYTAARKACGRLAAGVAVARTAPPIPDVDMQQLYRKALTEIGRGAAGCRAAIAQRSSGAAYFKVQHDVERLRQSTLVLSAGADDLYRATGEIKALERR